jgi:hypothetical protein
MATASVVVLSAPTTMGESMADGWLTISVRRCATVMAVVCVAGPKKSPVRVNTQLPLVAVAAAVMTKSNAVAWLRLNPATGVTAAAAPQSSSSRSPPPAGAASLLVARTV